MPVLFIRGLVEGDERAGRVLPLRLLPEGMPGVFVDGMVYPVVPGYRIVVDREAYYASDCPPTLVVSEAAEALLLRGVANIVELDGRIVRVKFSGSLDLLSAAVGLCPQTNLVLLGYGHSTDPISLRDEGAAAGAVDEWFMHFDGNKSPSTVEIDNLLHEASLRSGEFELPDDDPLVLRTQISLGAAQLSALEALLTEEREEWKEKVDKLLLQTEVMQAALTRYRALSLEAEVSQRALARAATKVSTTQSASDSADSSVADGLRRDLDVALENWRVSDIAATNARAQLTATSEELGRLRSELEVTRSVPAPIHSTWGQGRKRVRERDLEATLKALLPNVQPVGHSVTFVAEHVSNTAQLFILLSRINSLRKEDLPSKKVRGTDGWFECHFSTGQGDEGRLYFTWPKGTGQSSVRVLISSKGTQPHDIERLDSL